MTEFHGAQIRIRVEVESKSYSGMRNSYQCVWFQVSTPMHHLIVINTRNAYQCVWASGEYLNESSGATA